MQGVRLQNKGDDITTFIVPKVEKIRSLNLPEPLGPAQACSGKTLPLPYVYKIHSMKLSFYFTVQQLQEDQQCKVLQWNNTCGKADGTFSNHRACKDSVKHEPRKGGTVCSSTQQVPSRRDSKCWLLILQKAIYRGVAP